MLVADISDQLGNQMFAYASVKTIAERKGYSFGFVRADNRRINDTDSKYGNEIHTIFPQTKKDFLPELPSDLKYTFTENVLPHSGTFFSAHALKVQDQTYMKGHFISYLYFSDNLDEVRTWFSFPEDVQKKCAEKIEVLRKKYPGKKLIAIHFRVGKDYTKQGFLLRKSYWFRAARYMTRLYGRNKVLFVPFYDVGTKYRGIVHGFMRKYPCEVIKGSLVEDMCCLTMFDHLIVCNSSFSIMAGILNDRPGKMVLRPSVYPCGKGYQPVDCFPEDWITIPARRNVRSHQNYRYMVLKGRLLKLLRKNTPGASNV